MGWCQKISPCLSPCPGEQQISLGDVDEVTFWKNPGESGDWHLSFLQQLHVLGKGSFGVVYLVRHKLTKELAALKCIEKHHREQVKVSEPSWRFLPQRPGGFGGCGVTQG